MEDTYASPIPAPPFALIPNEPLLSPLRRDEYPFERASVMLALANEREASFAQAMGVEDLVSLFFDKNMRPSVATANDMESLFRAIDTFENIYGTDAVANLAQNDEAFHNQLRSKNDLYVFELPQYEESMSYEAREMFSHSMLFRTAGAKIDTGASSLDEALRHYERIQEQRCLEAERVSDTICEIERTIVQGHRHLLETFAIVKNI